MNFQNTLCFVPYFLDWYISSFRPFAVLLKFNTVFYGNVLYSSELIFILGHAVYQQVNYSETTIFIQTMFRVFSTNPKCYENVPINVNTIESTHSIMKCKILKFWRAKPVKQWITIFKLFYLLCFAVDRYFSVTSVCVWENVFSDALCYSFLWCCETLLFGKATVVWISDPFYLLSSV